MVMVNVKIYKRMHFIRDHVTCVKIFKLYIYIFILYIYIYKCMYVCICICIHVNVCHVFIVCHVHIYTCVYLVRVDPPPPPTHTHTGPACSPATLPSPHRPTFLWPSGEECFVGGGKLVTLNRRELTYTPPGGLLWKWEGNENYQNATIQAFPEEFPGMIGSFFFLAIPLHLCLPSNIITYLNTSFCPFYTNLLFPYVFVYVYVYVCTCARTYVRAYLWIPCILVCVCVVCVFFLSYRAVYLCSAHCVLRVLFQIHNHFCFPKKL